MSLFGGGKKAKSTVPDKLGSLRIQSQGYGNVIPVIFGTIRVPVTLFFYANFLATPVFETTKTGGKGGKKKKSSITSFSYSAAIMLGVSANPIQGIGKLWIDKKRYNSVSAVGFSFFGGTSSQMPWGYLSTYQPAKAVFLRGFSYLAANNYPLSDNAGLGNHSVEALGAARTGIEGDANPADIIHYILTSECSIPWANVADLTPYRSHCIANDLLLSVALDSQRSAGEVITDLLNLTGAELVNRNGQFCIISYDAPNLDSGYALSSDDFIAETGTSYIKLTRKKTIDSFNHVKLEFVNRATDYNIEIAEAKDAASIETIGLRSADTLTAHCITRASLASRVAYYLLYRDLTARNVYEFTLSPRHIRLEPMDVVTITNPTLGLYGHTVIIKKIVITSDYQLKVTAEDFFGQIFRTATTTIPETDPFIPDYAAAVSNINPPAIFLAPAALTATGNEIWCGISSDDPLYGGCDIYLSTDGGTSYTQIGTHSGETRMGVLTADLASGTAIDTTHTLAVDLTQSNGVLSSVSQLAVDASETLCRVRNEFIAYRETVLTAPAKYSINYLRRGLYGSRQGASTGDKFVRCDSTLFKFAFDTAYKGKTIQLKFPAYNIYDSGQQDISTVPAYNFTLHDSITMDSTINTADTTEYTMDTN